MRPVKPPRTPSKLKAKKVIIPFLVTEKFRDALQETVKREHRDVSKVIRMVLRERYPDLPEK